MIVEIQVLPRPAGTPDDPYKHVEAAIAVIASAGVTCQVGALGTTFEASPEIAWRISREAHAACLGAGADSVLTVLKLSQTTDDQGPTIDALTAKFRP